MKNKSIAYLTDNTTTMELSAGDEHLISILENDFNIDIIPWESDLDWSLYDLVLVRTTWDYMEKYHHFLEVLEKISTQTKLINSIKTIKWNINKKYLLELKELGFPIIPTSIQQQITKENVEQLFEQINKGHGIIIKPTIGASSQGIQFLTSPDQLIEVNSGEWFIQPFQKSIQLKGEYSLFFFGGKYSHAINKMPCAGEFRSQEEFHSTVTSITPSTKMKDLGEELISKIPVTVDYARMDVILDDEDEAQIVELELIEPCLFFKYAPEAAINFTQHISTLIKEN